MTAIISWRVLLVPIGRNCFAIKGDKDLEGTREPMVDLSCITVNEIMSARLGILAKVEYARKMGETFIPEIN